MLTHSCISLYFLCASVVNRIAFGFAFSARLSLTSAATAQQLRRGSHTGAKRGAQRHQPSFHAAICVDSAPSSLTSARHFGGKSSQTAISESFDFDQFVDVDVSDNYNDDISLCSSMDRAAAS